MRNVAIIALLHLAPAAVALCGFVPLALGIVLLLHLAVFASTLIPKCALFGKIITTTRRLPGECSVGKGVLLTFDDGPHPEITPRILDLLDQGNARAIFFLIGDKAREHPEIVRDIVERGHLIGNHTQTHPERTFWRLPPAELTKEIETCQHTLAEITGQVPTLFRPPVGMHNPMLFDLLREKNLPCVLWSHRGLDTRTNNIDQVVRRLTGNLRPDSILLIHDHLANAPEVTRRVLEKIENASLVPTPKPR